MALSCKEDIEHADRVLGLLQDLENIRADRLRIGMQSVARATFQGTKVNSVQLNNVSSMEVLSIKRFFLQSMQMFEKLVAAPQGQDPQQAAVGDSSGQGTGGGRKLRKHRK